MSRRLGSTPGLHTRRILTVWGRPGWACAFLRGGLPEFERAAAPGGRRRGGGVARSGRQADEETCPRSRRPRFHRFAPFCATNVVPARLQAEGRPKLNECRRHPDRDRGFRYINS